MLKDRLRVLLLAEKANPDWISVPLVGWKHVEAIASFADVHLVTHERNRPAIMSRAAARGFSPQHVTFVDTGSLDKLAHGLAKILEGAGAMGGVTHTAFQLPMYYRFEAKAWQLFAGALARGEFDLVHRVTPVSPGMPSLFAK